MMLSQLKLLFDLDSFFSKFEPVYYLKPIGSGRGWLFRVYPEDWQLYRQTREDIELVETAKSWMRDDGKPVFPERCE